MNKFSPVEETKDTYFVLMPSELLFWFECKKKRKENNVPIDLQQVWQWHGEMDFPCPIFSDAAAKWWSESQIFTNNLVVLFEHHHLATLGCFVDPITHSLWGISPPHHQLSIWVQILPVCVWSDREKHTVELMTPCHYGLTSIYFWLEVQCFDAKVMLKSKVACVCVSRSCPWMF